MRGGAGGSGGTGGASPGRRLSEREVWDRWLWGGLSVLGVILLAGTCSVTHQRGPAERVSPVPELPAAVEMDRPLLAVDVEGHRTTALRLLALEDARAPDAAAVSALEGHLEHASPAIRQMAVRALGRLEQAGLVEAVARGLSDPAPRVRMEAAGALVQAARGRGDEAAAGAAGAGSAPAGTGAPHAASPGAAALPERVATLLLEALEAEADPRVQGALARALGRAALPPGAAPGAEALHQRARRLAELTELPAEGVEGRAHHDERLLGLARGALFLARNAGGAVRQHPEGAQGLDLLARLTEGLALDAAHAGPVRRAAAAARVAAGPPEAAVLLRLLDDPEAEVRRIAASVAAGPAGAPGSAQGEAWRRVVERAFSDSDPTVRLEGVRGWARHHTGPEGCAVLVEGTRDPSDHVALVALEALGQGACGPEGAAILAEEAATLPGGTATWPSWHRPVRAVQGLAGLEARGLLEDTAALERGRSAMVRHPDPFVRAHVGRMSGVPDTVLVALAGDPDPNVRSAVLPGAVAAVDEARAAHLLASALAMDDPQLVRTVTRILEETGPPADAEARRQLQEAAAEALGRFEARGRSTDHDARVALHAARRVLGREAGAGAGAATGADPGAQTGGGASSEPGVPRPTGADNLPLPGWSELVALERGHLLLVLEGGGLQGTAEVRIQLLPFEAPTNAARTADLARGGALDGLTLHRVVPNFVVQGGSPSANEYAGHGAWTRDELGVPGHWQGTVGISTRGRDTGDGQIFVNLVDNLRLDHDYTVIGTVVEGWPALSQVQEGVRIREARWVETAPSVAARTGEEPE